MKQKLPKINSLFLIQYLMGKIVPYKKSGYFITSDGKKIYKYLDFHTISEAWRLFNDVNIPDEIKKELDFFIEIAVNNNHNN